jgi:hypothetical protein
MGNLEFVQIWEQIQRISLIAAEGARLQQGSHRLHEAVIQLDGLAGEVSSLRMLIQDSRNKLISESIEHIREV